MDIRRRAILSEILYGGGSNEEPINIDNYLTIEALEDGLTASLSNNACEYCVDGDGNWKTLTAGTVTESINSGHTLSFRGNLNPVSYEGIGTFTISKKCNLKGNCMSMLFGDSAANNYNLSGKNYAFYQLFYNCNNIVTVSSNFLPALSLGHHCYCYMFMGCTSLINTPELPATSVYYQSYGYMFANCTSLIDPPVIKNVTRFINLSGLGQQMKSMFSGCTSLTTAPELPKIIEQACYSEMFSGCTSLTTAPELPVTTLNEYCYYRMFNGCTSLTTAPELPATTLANNCYDSMFWGCSNLNYIKMLATDISARNCLNYWVSNVASTGTFVKHPDMTTLPTGSSGIPRGWTVVNNGEPIINIDNYLTIEARENGLTASLSKNACEYCVDGDGNWKTLSAGTATESINSGQTLSFRGNITPNSSNGIGTFTISKKCNLKGNCMSMLFGDNAANNLSLSGKNYAFYKLFSGCTTIMQVSESFLPATTLANYCYSYMFYGCSGLTSAPELPDTTLANYCYQYMFRDCTSLTVAPELPATTLASCCYDGMFSGCTSLTVAPELPATTLDISCYSSMFHGCTSLTVAPELPATTLSSGCYQFMFYGCTSLTVAPELPATTLSSGCYKYMFQGCRNLNYIKMLATDISATNCLIDWVSGVSSTGTFVKNPAMTTLPTGTSGIPSRWTVVNDGGDLYLTLNTTNADNIKAYQIMETQKVLAPNRIDYDWIPSTTTIYVSGEAGRATFTNVPIDGACKYSGLDFWDVFFENRDAIGPVNVCNLHPDGLLEAYDDD